MPSAKSPEIQWEWQVFIQGQLIKHQLLARRTDLRFLFIGLKASTLVQIAHLLGRRSDITLHAFPSADSGDATAIAEDMKKPGLQSFIPVELLAIAADQLYDRYDAYDYVCVEEGAWPSTVERVSSLLRMVRERGWICCQPRADSFAGNERIQNFECLLKFVNSVGSVRRHHELLFVQKSTSSPIADEVALCRILHRSQYDPDFRRRLIEGLPLPTNSARFDTATSNLNLVFTESDVPPELGSEVLSDNRTCVLPRALWRSVVTRRSLRQSLLRAMKHSSEKNAGA
jgi:hypothetical protein